MQDLGNAYIMGLIWTPVAILNYRLFSDPVPQTLFSILPDILLAIGMNYLYNRGVQNSSELLPSSDKEDDGKSVGHKNSNNETPQRVDESSHNETPKRVDESSQTDDTLSKPAQDQTPKPDDKTPECDTGIEMDRMQLENLSAEDSAPALSEASESDSQGAKQR